MPQIEKWFPTPSGRKRIVGHKIQFFPSKPVLAAVQEKLQNRKTFSPVNLIHCLHNSNNERSRFRRSQRTARPGRRFGSRGDLSEFRRAASSHRPHPSGRFPITTPDCFCRHLPNGRPWDEIGLALGRTGEAVRKQYHRTLQWISRELGIDDLIQFD